MKIIILTLYTRFVFQWQLMSVLSIYDIVTMVWNFTFEDYFRLITEEMNREDER